ncbi:TMM8B-like protein [Mya arenaria]|uniref:TMM8B-like protein n=1 Tax=Mya arenaria TaxID=6604 RepID=A0ABY7FRS8_MYAAR|nr:TMM8B-like protein [Mya arenaria]
MLFPLTCVSMSFILHFIKIEGAVFSEVYWTTAIRLSEYSGYKSVSLLSYNIPSQTTQVTFTFQAKTSGSACTFREVHVYFQHGSYPLVTPYNETFPEDFYTNRTEAYNIQIVKDADPVSYLMTAPKPGTWYFTAFLPKNKNDKIEQKGFDKSCLYGMVVIVEAVGLDNIPQLDIDMQNQIALTQDTLHSQRTFRFSLPSHAVKYNVRIDSCNVKLSEQPNDAEDENSSNESQTGNNSSFTNETTYRVTVDNATANGPLSSKEITTSTTTAATTSRMTTAPLVPTTPTNINNCPVLVHIQSGSLSLNGAVSMTDCGNKTVCKESILSPDVEGWTYITMEIDKTYKCESLKLYIPKTIFHPKPVHTAHVGPSQDSCILISPLGRFVWSEQTFNVTYVLSDRGGIPAPMPITGLNVEDHFVLVMSFSIQEMTDIGGTLALHADLNLQEFDISHQNVTVYICLMKTKIPGGSTVRDCQNGLLLTMNMTTIENTVYIPYPEPVWCNSVPTVDLSLGLSGCVRGQCGEYGVCQDYISGVHVFSSCKCFAGWRGYGCTDGTEGRTKHEELVALLLLTLSNLFFLPAICLATYRRYFVEAVVYTYTIFADFLGSISSFWVTMLVMSKLPWRVRGFAQTIGVLGVAVGVEYDRHGLLVFAVPAGLAAVIMVGSWIFQCKRQRKLYPIKRYFLFHFLPGVILALTGLSLFAFLETENNYKYTHSCWHIAMSLSIVFLLPTRPRKGTNTDTTTNQSSLETNITNANSQVLLYSYANLPNGSTVREINMEAIDNPSYISPYS